MFTAVSLFEKRGIRVAGVILQVVVPFFRHVKSCFLSIYRVVFDSRVSARRDMYKVVDTVIASEGVDA